MSDSKDKRIKKLKNKSIWPSILGLFFIIIIFAFLLIVQLGTNVVDIIRKKIIDPSSQSETVAVLFEEYDEEHSEEIEDSIISEITSINDTVYSINAEKTTQTVGVETIEVIKSLEDITLDDGTEIYVGDVIEIHKYIDSVEVYTYSIIEDEFYNPFI